MAVININSDQEPDIPTEQGLCLQSVVSPSVLPGGTTIEEDEIDDEEYDPLKTPKRKRDLTIVISDDELEETEVIPKRRALKIENSDNEGEENKDDDELKVVTSNDELKENEVTPKRRALKIGTSYNEGEEDKDDDDDALVKTPKRKNDRRVVTSDDELEEIEVIPTRRALKIENSDNEVEEDKDYDDDDDDALPIRQIFNRAKPHIQSDDEDNIPISQLVMNRGQGSRSDDCPSVSRCPKRRLVKCGQSENIDRNQEMNFFPDSVTKKYVEDEDESGSDDSLSDFIVDDTCDENLEDDLEDGLEDDLSEDSNRHSDEPEEGSDDNLGFEGIISRLQRRKDLNSEWEFQADMLSDFGKDPELCMRGVCAIYRRQRTKEQSWIEGDDQRGIGFNKYDVGRGAILADFLTDGNPEGNVVKTVEELQDYDPEGPEVCRTLAGRYSNQLFEIYENEEDPFFP